LSSMYAAFRHSKLLISLLNNLKQRSLLSTHLERMRS
jgi:hypothetical protein